MEGSHSFRIILLELLSLDVGKFVKLPLTVNKPGSLFKIRVHRKDLVPVYLAACAGYERGEWRYEQVADYLMEWLPEFALTESEWRAISHGNAVAQIRHAASVVYKSKKFQKRGEFGELLLHALVREVYHSIPAISKIYYKTAHNDTVKGFDAVHVVGPPDDMELWLGEAKFYTDVGAAIREVVKELEQHLGADYLRDEFMLISGKIDPKSEHAEALQGLLSAKTSLDEIFSRVCIPILLTYDSKCLASHAKNDAAYIKQFEDEVHENYTKLKTALESRTLPEDVEFHLFLVPLHTKRKLVSALDRKLKTWQRL